MSPGGQGRGYLQQEPDLGCGENQRRALRSAIGELGAVGYEAVRVRALAVQAQMPGNAEVLAATARAQVPECPGPGIEYAGRQLVRALL